MHSSRAYTEIASIAERFALSDVYVFGSRANELVPAGELRRDTASDVDVAVRPRSGTTLSVHQRVDLMLALERLFELSPVDLVVLPDADAFLALAAIRGTLIYCADTVDQAEYELFVLRRAGDLAPFERERQELILRGGR